MSLALQHLIEMQNIGYSPDFLNHEYTESIDTDSGGSESLQEVQYMWSSSEEPSLSLEEYATMSLRLQMPQQLVALGFDGWNALVELQDRIVVDPELIGRTCSAWEHWIDLLRSVRPGNENGTGKETQNILNNNEKKMFLDGITNVSSSHTTTTISFPWPVSAMANYEFREPEGCDPSLENIIVITHLPPFVSEMNIRIVLEELLFRQLDWEHLHVPDMNINDGWAFVAFSSSQIAQQAARGIDGLTWSDVHSPLSCRVFNEYRGMDVLSECGELTEEEEGNVSREVPELSLQIQELKRRNIELELECTEWRETDSYGKEVQIQLIEQWHNMKDLVIELKTQRDTFEGLSTHQGATISALTGKIQHLRTHVQHLLGQSLTDVSIEKLSDLETALEQAMVRIRHEKTKQMEKRRVEETLDGDNRLCVICLSEARGVLVLPCRHLCLCLTCSTHTSLDKCPVCRQEIEDKWSIFA